MPHPLCFLSLEFAKASNLLISFSINNPLPSSPRNTQQGNTHTTKEAFAKTHPPTPMKKTIAVPPDIDRSRSDPKPSDVPGYFDAPPTKSLGASSAQRQVKSSLEAAPISTTGAGGLKYASSQPITARDNELIRKNSANAEKGSSSITPNSAKNGGLGLAGTSSSQDEKQGSVLDGNNIVPGDNNGSLNNNNNDAENPPKKGKMGNFIDETRKTTWMIITHSWINILLVFVPVGIAVGCIPGIHPGIVFGVNCVAIIPLAGLLSYATESVAREMGDALGALLNVTFGNAVELIIFIIALTKDQIRIVQASLLGSILANLLLILGMGFFLGGLRYREQVYNSTVTQMSACLLSLSVISLVLPTAFHASFKDEKKAREESLKISRGTSVILLLVYGIYLLFQLKSHAYLYESTPQHIVDAEAIPGPAAGWLDTSSSDSSSDTSSDSDSSSHSRDTVRKKMKRALRGGRRRKSPNGSVDGNNNTRSPSIRTAATTSPQDEESIAGSSTRTRPNVLYMPSTDAQNEDDVEEDDDGSYKLRKRRYLHRRKKDKKSRRRSRKSGGDRENAAGGAQNADDDSAPRRVDFAIPSNNAPPTAAAANADGDGDADDEGAAGAQTTPSKRPGFQALRGMSVRNLAPTVFTQRPEEDSVMTLVPSGPVPRVRYGIRRTNSLPDRLFHQQPQYRAPGGLFPTHVPISSVTTILAGEDEDEHLLSQTTSIILLLVSTGLVAACAEFLVGSIDAVVKTSSIKEIFIGLIILPIVGNAAEHVTAITVAMKNKMDLAIGVALGSSIQIAIFVTPLIVILGWILNHEMTLYFTLFETVCLFVSTFMVNFLVLDGRSNYLEGALLCAVYLIIAVVAFFYPDGNEASSWAQ